MRRPMPQIHPGIVYVTTIRGTNGRLAALEKLISSDKKGRVKITDHQMNSFPVYWAVANEDCVEFDIYRPSHKNTQTQTFQKLGGMVLTPLLQCSYTIDSYRNEEVLRASSAEPSDFEF